MAANILSPEERQTLSTVPIEIGDADLVRFFTLEPADLALIDPYADPDQQGELQPPAARTSRLHAQRAREHLHWRKYTVEEDRLLAEWLKPLAAEHDYGRVLLDPKSPSKSGRAISLYTHVSDHAIPFYGQVIHPMNVVTVGLLSGNS